MTAFVLVFALVVAPVLFVRQILAGGKTRRAQLEASRAMALRTAEQGWHALTTSLPVEVAAAAASGNTRFARELEREGRRCWVVWHRWTESTGNLWERYTFDMTVFFLQLDEGYPDIDVDRRSATNSFARAVTTAATFDEFDRAFAVTTEFPDAADRFVPLALRQKMLSGEMPPWRITDGVLVMAFNSPPQEEDLMPGVERLLRLAGMIAR